MDTILTTVNVQGVALLELNREPMLNALSQQLLEEVREALADWAEDDAVKALVVTGRGRAFCAGADLSVSMSAGGVENASIGEIVAQGMLEQFNPTMMALHNFPKPVIVAVNGIAAGGGVGLALCGDIILASERAALKVVQVKQLGIAADLGANWLLQRIVGRSRAMWMCLTGETVTAARLLDWGAVIEVVPDDKLLARAFEYAVQLAAAPAPTIRATRQLIDEAPGVTFEESLEHERIVQRELCDDPVFTAQVLAFMGNTKVS